MTKDVKDIQYAFQHKLFVSLFSVSKPISMGFAVLSLDEIPPPLFKMRIFDMPSTLTCCFVCNMSRPN